jgi:excisionase family DNA binding protein
VASSHFDDTAFILISLDEVQSGIVGVVVNLDGVEYLTAEEACRLLGVKAATLYAYVSRGVLTSYRQGIRRRRLYKRHEVEALLQIRPSAAGEPGAGARAGVREVPRAEDWIPFVN